ncbi:MAG: hypothetical protein IKI58_12370 [Oscillospiraceae bacterium]|nr:hypothetical protein [Oscillospiraceae bacterium]
MPKAAAANKLLAFPGAAGAGKYATGCSGITLKNYKFGMGCDNIIARYIADWKAGDMYENDSLNASDL